ncbi:tripartite tricarboxylate transporter substrate binding protein [Polaromonas sp. P1-6]|nr:tripartite tricarboxylate transporter substrate binding protein [Polaromonas sp. P1-6]
MDVVARVLADQLSKDVGAPFFVDNKRGAGGNVAVASLLSSPSPSDGQTIMIAFDNILTEIPHVIKQNFSPKDIRPIAAFARSGFVLVGNPDLPAADFTGLIAYLKANPQKDTFASYAVGSASHYAGLMLGERAGLKLQHIPFVGSPPALVNVMGGQIPIMIDGIATSLPLIRGGKLKPYAVVAKSRSPDLPNVPTFAELGYPEINFSNLAVVIVPSGVPSELVEKIRTAVYKAAGGHAGAKAAD